MGKRASSGEKDASGTVRPGTLTALLREIAEAPSPEPERLDAGLRPGLVVGRFELLRELGRGGFGVVWEAKDRELGRRVAFKVVRAGSRRDLREERLLREAEAAAQLSHPNIVTLHDVGRSECGPYLVLELLEGKPLAERVSRGALPVKEAVHVGAEVARGLAHAHGHGVVHRDLKPENVFVCANGQVKVLDFGLAHAFGQQRQAGGTSGYMAPEQVEGAPEDERTDVWALGVMLFEMLVGRRPFADEGALRRDAPGLDVPGLPALGELVGRMLAARPVDRPRDGADVLEALAKIEQEVARSAAAVAAPVRTRRRRGHRLPAAIAAGLLAVLAVAAGLWWRGRTPGRTSPDGRLVVAVADVVNETGEKELDVLSGLLVTSLEQSRKLSVMTQARVLDLAIRDGRKESTRVDETLGREVGSAHGVRALLLPAIRKLGATYSLEMRAVDPGRDEHLFTLSDRATSKEGLLGLLDRLSERTRTELGEGRGEVERSRVQLGEALTRSVEAYQHYVAGLEGWLRDGQRAVALRELPTALELDPGFAAAHSDLAFLYFAYGRPDLAVPHWREADENADRMPEKERGVLMLRRSFSTPSAESWSRDDALRLAGELSRRFSGDKYVLLEVADAYAAFGMDDLRDGALRKALDLDPGLFVAARDLSARLGTRTEEALEVARRAVATRRSAANLSLLAEALHASGATEEAAATAREALRLDGGRNSLVVERSCFTLRQGGSAPECVAVWERMAAGGQNPLERDVASAAVVEDLFVRGRVREGLRAMRSLEEARRGEPTRLAYMLVVGRSRLDAPLALEQARRIPYPHVRRNFLSWLGAHEEAARVDGSIRERSIASWEAAYQATRAAGERRFAEAADLIQQVQAKATNRNYPGWLFSQSSLTAETLLAAGRAEEAARVWPATPACRCRDPVDHAVNYPALALVRARAMEQLGRRAEAIRELDGVVAFWKEADDDLPLLVEAKATRKRLAAAPATARALAVAKAPTATPSIAVLPFADMSPGKDQEYLSAGIAEEILNALSSVEELRVPGRVSSFYFKGRSVEPAEIARKLGVAHLLNGSVRHSGGRIRVTAEVVRISSGERLWSQTFERDMADVFAVQDEIAGAVVEALKVRLLAGTAYSGPRPTTTTSPEAYSQYLLGQRLYRQGTPDSFRQAVRTFEKAVALDPSYAPAWAAMGIPMFYVGAYATSQAEALAWAEKALAAAEKALALAPDLCDGLSTRGSLRESVRWDWTGGRADLARAVRLCPGSPDGWRRYAIMLSTLGRLEEAIPPAERAAQLDPLGYSNLALAKILRAAGKNERSLAVAERALEAMPDSNTACGDVAAALLALGRAAESLERFRRCPGGWAYTRHGIVRALWSLGRADEARSLLRREEEQPSPKWVHIGIAYAWMGDGDRAFEWLNRAVDAHDLLLGDGFLAWAELRPLHTDPRWKALRRRLNLPVD